MDFTSDFTSSVDTVDEVTKRIKVTIPAATLQKEVDESLVKLSRTANIKGFRQGKAPRQIIEKMYGEGVRYDAAQKMINGSLTKVAKDQSLEIIGSPEVDITSFESNKDLEFTAQVSLFPSPEVKDYKGVAIKVEREPVSEADVQTVIDRLLKSKATQKKIEGRTEAQASDVVDLTISVNLDGEKKERPEPLVVGLGEHALPEELEKGIVGMQVGTSSDIEASAPPAARNAGNSGKAHYRVTLNALYERILPEFDDAFVKNLAQPGAETVLELRLKVRKDLEEQSEADAKSRAQGAVVDELAKSHEFKIPQVLIDDEIRSLLVRYGVMDGKKAEAADVEPFRKELGEIAIRRVKGAIIIDRISQAESIKAEKEDVDKEIESLAAQNGVTAENVRKYVMERERVVGFLMEITRTKVISFLVQQAKIEYVDKKPEDRPSGTETVAAA